MRNLKKILALVLAMVMTLSVMSVAGAFTDDESISANYKEAADVLAGLKVFQGRPDGSFDPKGSITRAEVAAIIYRIATGDVDNKQVGIYVDYNKFPDVTSDKWYAGYVNYCANAEYVKGRPDGKFDPDATVTGYEALAMILRAIGYDKNGEFTGPNWSINTASIAKQRHITDKVAEGTLNTAATREVVAELLFKTILVNTVTYTPAFGYTENKTSLGYDKFQLEYIEGVVTGNEWADLYDVAPMAEGKTQLGDRVLNVTTAITDIGEARYAYVSGKTVYAMGDTGTNTVVQTGEAVSNLKKFAGMNITGAEKFLNFSGSDTYTSDWRIEYVIKLVDEDDDALLDTDGKTDLVKANKGSFGTGADANTYTKVIKAGAKITAQDMSFIRDIFTAADKEDNYILGEVYVGTKSTEDISDEISFKTFLADYIEDDSTDADVSGNENGNWLKVVDVNGDGDADYIMKTVFDMTQITDITKKGNYIVAGLGEIKSSDVVTEDELEIGNVVVIALIDGVYYVDIADAVTEVIDKRGVNAKDETITCGDNVYGQSGIYYENIGLEHDILDAETEVSYDLYLDHFGFVRLYTESSYNNGFVLLLDGYYKTDRRNDDFKAQIWNTEDEKAEDVVVADSRAYPASAFIDTYEGDSGNRGTWYRLLEADLTYAPMVKSEGILTNIAAYSVDEDGEYTLANIADEATVSNKKDYRVTELVLNNKSSVKDRTLTSIDRSFFEIQATTNTQYYFVVRGNGINKNVETVYSWTGYKNAPAEAALYGTTYAYAVTSEGTGSYEIAEVVVFESDAAVSNALNFVYAVDNKTLAKAAEAQVIGYDAETEKYAADLWRDVDDADLDALVEFYKIYSDESVEKITTGSYNKNRIYAGPAKLALDVTSRDYQKVTANGDNYYFAPAETPCYIVNYDEDGNARTMYSVEEQNYRFEIGDELIFVTDKNDNVLYVINATQSTWMDGKVEKTVAALDALYAAIMNEQNTEIEIETWVEKAEKLVEVAPATRATAEKQWVMKTGVTIDQVNALLAQIEDVLADKATTKVEYDDAAEAKTMLDSAIANYNANQTALGQAKTAALAALAEAYDGLTNSEAEAAIDDYKAAQAAIEAAKNEAAVDTTLTAGLVTLSTYQAIPESGEDPVVETMNTALESGGEVVLPKDIAVTSAVNIGEGAVLDGDGKTIDASKATTTKGDCILNTLGGTIQNVNLLGAPRGIGSGSSGTNTMEADLVVDNVFVDEGTYALNIGQGGGKKLNVTDSTLYGWTSYSGLSLATFTNCIFGQGKTDWSYIRPYDDTVLDGCTFEDGFKMGANETGIKITLTDCTYNGVKVTAENFEELLIEAGDTDIVTLRQCTITVDGKTVTLTSAEE